MFFCFCCFLQVFGCVDVFCFSVFSRVFGVIEVSLLLLFSPGVFVFCLLKFSLFVCPLLKSCLFHFGTIPFRSAVFPVRFQALCKKWDEVDIEEIYSTDDCDVCSED